MAARTSTTQKRRAPAKKQSRPRTRTKSNSKRAKQSAQTHQFAAILLMAAALLLAALAFLPGTHVWLMLHRLLFGLLGPLAYALPPLCAYVAVAVALDKPLTSVRIRLLEAILFLLLICGTVHIFSFGGFPGLYTLYDSGVRLHSGGLFGGLVGAPLYMIFGKAGAAATLIILAVADFFLLTGLTILHVIRALRVANERRRSLQAAYAAARAQASGDTAARKRKPAQIDLPLTDSDAASKTEKSIAGLDELVGKIAKLGDRPEANPEQPEKPHAAPAASTMEKPDKAPEKSETEPQEPHIPIPYQHPSVTLLKTGSTPNTHGMAQELKENAERLVETLRSFGVETRITDICRGPTVTRYEIQPSAGVKISRITSLADDIALNLAAAGVRIEAPIPNKSAVGIEVPNKNVSIVHIRQILESGEFVNAQSRLTIALGNDIAGNSTVADIGKMPHLLIAGATGSGKSVCINSIIISLLYKAAPKDVKLLLVDPKVVELGIYNGIPHLLVPVVTDPRKAAGALNWAVTEMLNRYKIFADNNVRDLHGYNALARRTEGLDTMPQIVIIIDELSDLMMVASKDVEDAICRLAQMARAAGMHLVIATQRPSVDVITGVIKANIPSRIAFAVSSQVDSRTILDMGGAEKLLGRGDMLFLPIGASKPMRVQGCFVSDDEVEQVVDFVKQSASPDYDDAVLDEIEKQAARERTDDASQPEEADAMLPQAIECVVEAGMASTSLLQRRLKLGYARAARIVDEMEARGIVGPLEGSKPRTVLISRQQWIEMNMNQQP
ncbi:FtsK/SpoIIIE family DNA translocase [Ethanoligenens harbinense]|uniref:Cell division protein FtsK/SpoIIIE n=1 Tax=Ethanoligenens harbinense (strain DSM 18485 / JCM 12961 / CGMCC 1.5033 / YUAN-3) TaxID=663278 RepID=E6U6W4_ETHHY|nr:DNA translocase FtsK [Ethanoligenens harbinense]ADU26931.1 cell division protein FtsK/SpoIIIE [Ethanoligenens harbinense YUAN-3]AVQ96024.1 DNA translocase FtsK [Ethanoligenens harbinense YUAN-3]AYF38685.1 DNA translocase FtsK [Ethanoligenens harbinense]AYF41432.1 DNA translocase FtsK [Ethanoligenens harbinense]QCN92266.1 DNA translocase FtsK [Ethanoligenens harbinense]